MQLFPVIVLFAIVGEEEYAAVDPAAVEHDAVFPVIVLFAIVGEEE